MRIPQLSEELVGLLESLAMRCKQLVTVAFSLGFGVLCGACGSSEKEERDDLEAFAQTALTGGSTADDKVREKDEAARKEAFAKKQAAEEAERKAYDDTMAKILVLPDEMPASVDVGCKDMLESYHEYMLRVLAGDDGALLDWYDRKKTELGARRGTCVKLDSLEAVGCQINALDEAPAEFVGHELDIMRECAEKFAADKLAELAEDTYKKPDDSADQAPAEGEAPPS